MGANKAKSSKPSMRYTGEYEEDDGSLSTTYRDTAQRSWIQKPNGEVRMHPDSVAIEKSKRVHTRVGTEKGRDSTGYPKKYAGGGKVRGQGCAIRSKSCKMM